MNANCPQCGGSGVVWKDSPLAPSEIEKCPQCKKVDPMGLWGVAPESEHESNASDFAAKIAAKLHSGEWYSEEETAEIIREIVMAESKRTSIVVMILDHDAQDNSYRWNQYAGPFKSADDAKEWARLNRGEVMTKLIRQNAIAVAPPTQDSNESTK